MDRTNCELCEKEIIDNEIIVVAHFIMDFSFMMLFLIKMFSWMFYNSLFKLGSLRSFPCKCNHKAFWHLSSFEQSYLPLDRVNWFYLLFLYKLQIDKRNPLVECLRCMFKINKSKYEDNRCFGFQPINNLIYLENIHNKKK